MSSNVLGAADNHSFRRLQSCFDVRAAINGSRIFAWRQSHRGLQAEPQMKCRPEVRPWPLISELKYDSEVEKIKMNATCCEDEPARLCPSQQLAELLPKKKGAPQCPFLFR